MFSRLRPKTFPLDTHKQPALVPAAHRRLNIHCYSYTRLKQRKVVSVRQLCIQEAVFNLNCGLRRDANLNCWCDMLLLSTFYWLPISLCLTRKQRSCMYIQVNVKKVWPPVLT